LVACHLSKALCLEELRGLNVTRTGALTEVGNFAGHIGAEAHGLQLELALPHRFVGRGALNAGLLSGLRRLYPRRLINAYPLRARKLLSLRRLDTSGLFDAYSLRTRKLGGPGLLHSCILAYTNTLHARGLLGPTLLCGHTCGPVPLELHLCLLEGSLRPGGLNVPELTPQSLFRHALLHGLSRSAKRPSLHRLCVAPCLHPLELPERVVLLTAHDGLHVWVHVLLDFGAAKLPRWVKRKLLPATGAKICKRRGLAGLEARVWRHACSLKSGCAKLSRLLLPELPSQAAQPAHHALCTR
jgi:hypothetical protein